MLIFVSGAQSQATDSTELVLEELVYRFIFTDESEPTRSGTNSAFSFNPITKFKSLPLHALNTLTNVLGVKATDEYPHVLYCKVQQQ